jgi:hypothetical protein
VTAVRSGSVLRLRARWLATPVLWYRHAGTGKRLILVLASHIGEAGYFAAMCRRISECEARGYAVQWEGITKAPAQAWAEAAEAERAAHQVLTNIYQARPRALAASLGWVYQGDVKTPDSWASGDLTDLELVRAIGPAAIGAMAGAVIAGEARLGARAGAYETAMGPLTMRALARPHAPLSQAIANLAPDVNAILLAQRSKLAVAAVNPGRDTVMVWGAEHADSIGEALAVTGWEAAGTRRWLTVGRLPPLARSLADIAAVACGAGADTFRAARAEAKRGS